MTTSQTVHSLRPLTTFVMALLASAIWIGSQRAEAADFDADHWRKFDDASTITLDHSAFSALLALIVKPDGSGLHLVDYGSVTAERRQELDSYVETLASALVTGLGRDEQLAYWINLYNALTLQVILDHYPVDSIRDIGISPGFFTVGPWKAPLVTVEGQNLSLDNIEHDILRPQWKTPLIHYGVNCASIGCPNLLPEAYRGATVVATLEKNAADYINHPRGARVDKGRLIASKIYTWFQEDFGGSEEGVIDHLLEYADPELKKALAGQSSIARFEYDWSLNDHLSN